ncbi:MAG TPA: hypothetical protein VE863_06380, partial [Pyrinomonadaceae bacterium]|nr:hypothetical protein [Pyrinomonadaceae bacterium]
MKRVTIDTAEIVDKKDSGLYKRRISKYRSEKMMKRLSGHPGVIAFALVVALVLGCKTTMTSNSSSTSDTKTDTSKNSNS